MTKVTQDKETLENKKRSYDSIFKGIHKQHLTKGEGKENRRKSNERKRKRNETNVQRVHEICVENLLGNGIPQCLVYTPSLDVPEESCLSVSKLRMSPHRYLDEMGDTSHSSWKGIISAMMQEAESPPTFTKKSETMFIPSCTLKSTLTESISKTYSHSSTIGEEQLDDSEDEDECQ